MSRDNILCTYCMKIHDRDVECKAKREHKKMLRQNRKKYMTEEQKKYDRFYSTHEWIKCRDEVLKENEYCCEICEYLGRLNYKNTKVHHVIKLRDDWSKRVDKNNLLVVCDTHHRAIEGMSKEEIIKYAVYEKQKIEANS